MEANVQPPPGSENGTDNMRSDSVEPVNTLNPPAKSGLWGAAGARDRRKRMRARLHWAVLLFRENSASYVIESVTCNLSSSGFYCLSRVELLEGEYLACSIRIPNHDPQGNHLERVL